MPTSPTPNPPAAPSPASAQPHLFRPLALRSVTTKNRIMLSPMCQYSANGGATMNAWHTAHLAARAVGGCGIVFTEAVNTSAEGRITHHCLGLWNDQQTEAMRPVVDFVAAQGAVPAIQVGHAGRKASMTRPWEGGRPLAPDEGAWPTISPTDLPFKPGWPAPIRMDADSIQRSLDGFRSASKRAREAGFQVLEIHAAHGYLAHQFLSPLTNDREDAYGGSFDNRIRFLLETVGSVRSAWPADLPLFVRLSCVDWVDGGWSLDDTIELCKRLKATGDVDLIDCSSGGNDPRQRIPVGPGYQVPFAAAVRSATGLATAAVGMIANAEQAESILANGQADLVAIGRKMLADPMWPLHAARTLKAVGVKWPVQYERADIF